MNLLMEKHSVYSPHFSSIVPIKPVYLTLSSSQASAVPTTMKSLANEDAPTRPVRLR